MPTPAIFDPFAHPENLALTTRAREITKLRAIYDGRQYEGRANWWTGKLPGQRDDEVKPLRERAPCIVYRLPRAATEQVVRFLLGDGRWPSLIVKAEIEDEPEPEETPEPPEQTPEQAALGLPPPPAPKPEPPPKRNPILERMRSDIALDEDEAEALQTYLSDAIEAWQIKPRFRAVAKTAIACKTGVLVLGMRDGKLHIEQPLPEHCAAKFRNDDPYDEVLELLQCYQYDAEVTDERGQPKAAKFLYRRQWDATACYEWEPVEVKHGAPIKWGAPTVTPHGWAFCPVLWIPNGDGESAQGVDGTSLFQDSADEIEALDFTLSQRHRGLTFYGSPQMVETGVADDDGPGASGRTTVTVGADGSTTSSATGARKTGPGTIWTYYSPEVEHKLLETSGKAFEVASLHVADIRSRLLETWGVVLSSMNDQQGGVRTTMGAEMSARFLALAHAPLIGLVSELRHIWWPYGLQRLVSMALRMVADLGGKGVLVPGSEEIAKILARFYTDGPDGRKLWTCPRIDPAWGDFFDPSYAEIKESVEATTKAHDGGLICHETAITATAQAFSVEDVQHELDEIEEEDSKDADRTAAADMSALSKVHGFGNANAGAAKSGAGTNAPPTAGGGGGAVAAPAPGNPKAPAGRPAFGG